MIPCPHCACHVRASDATCVHCGRATWRQTATLRSTVAGALLGLSVACVGTTSKDATLTDGYPTDSTTTPQPTYGVTTTGETGGLPPDATDYTTQDDYADTSDADTDVDADSDVDADTDTDTGATGHTGNVADSGATGGSGAPTGGGTGDTGKPPTGDTGGPVIQPLYGVVPTP